MKRLNFSGCEHLLKQFLTTGRIVNNF